MVTILFPSDYFQKNQVDPDLEDEARAVLHTEGLQLAVFDYEQWFLENKLQITLKPKEKASLSIYRGWMLKPGSYEDFYEALQRKGFPLLVSPEEYNTLHLFPKAYPLIKKDTAPTMTFQQNERPDVEKITQRFHRFLVKDDVKAVRGSNFPVYFEKGLTQEEFDEYLKTFYKIRGESLTGGLCIKEYLDLKTDLRGRTNEYRAFYLKGKLISLSPDSGQDLPEDLPPQELLEKYATLPSPFYSMDIAELKEGGWKILETGDGQVSRLSPGQNIDLFYDRLAKELME